MTKEELKNYLIDEAEYDFEEVNGMDGYDLFDSYLKYNGILGYTNDILNACKAAFGYK